MYYAFEIRAKKYLLSAHGMDCYQAKLNMYIENNIEQINPKKIVFIS